VTEDGAKLQVAPEGSPLQPKLTSELNPFIGVTVNVASPTLSGDNGQSGWCDRQLVVGTKGDGVGCARDSAIVIAAGPAIAWRVSVELTVIGPFINGGTGSWVWFRRWCNRSWPQLSCPRWATICAEL